MVKLGGIYDCEIIHNAKGKKPSGTRVKEKTFPKGKQMELMAVNSSKMSNGYILSFVTKDGYLIDKFCVFPKKEIGSKNDAYENAEVLETKSKSSLSNIQGDGNINLISDDFKKKSNIVGYSAVIGGGYMLFRSYKNGGNKMIYASIGVIVGGFIGMQISKLKK